MNTIQDEFEKLSSMDKYLIETKLLFIGKGSGRKVYAVNEDYVIKVPRDSAGVLQSKVENNIYESANEKLKEYLCPIVYFNNDRIIMRRALPLNSFISNRSLNMLDILGSRRRNDFLRELRPLIKNYDLLYEDTIAISSWGILDKRPVLIDYGCTNRIYSKYFL